MGDFSLIDLPLRLLPEGFIIILAGYAVSKTKIENKKYVLTSIIHAVVTALIKMLPVSQIMHMALSIIAAVILLTLLCNIKVLYSTISTIICFILSILTEGINMLLLGNVFGLDLEVIFEDASPLLSNLYGLPSLFLFAMIVVVYYLINRRKANDVDNNENS